MMADAATVVSVVELSNVERVGNTVKLKDLYSKHRTALTELLDGGDGMKIADAFFTKGRSTKRSLIEKARAKETDYVQIGAFKIKVRNCEDISNDVLTYPRFCALLAYAIISRKDLITKYKNVMRSLGSGLKLEDASEDNQEVFNCALIPGSAFLPMAFLGKKDVPTRESLITATACIALDYKYLVRVKKQQDYNIIELLQNISDFDEEVSCIKQLVRQGFFDKLRDNPVARQELVDHLSTVDLSEDSNIGQRVISAIKMLLKSE